ncbi:MAG: alpha/beta hydrolase, partial [Eudoraea sp.]|uniref:alpha/beta hydrolase n=1 Tax=Eudoraea sp. TaxID=1979955 RepID=UPI003C790CC9
FGSGAKFASLVPSFIKQIRGVISIGSPVANVELLNTKNPFYFVGIVGNEDYNYPDMLSTKLVLGKLKFPNNLIVYDGGAKDYDSEAINQAIEILVFSSMAKGIIPRKEDFIVDSYHRGLAGYSALMNTGNQYKAQYELSQLISIYQPLIEIDSLQDEVKNVKKQKTYKTQKRSFNNLLFKESLIREEFEFNLNEDINSLNYNNLGWWNYQMGELKKYDAKPDPLEVQMGKRLLSYLNALIEDYIDMEKSQQMVNDEVLSYLWMLKTITEPSNYKYYLNIISDSAKYEDYGTALFYLEELLKQGYTDKEELYSLDNTALLRIMPEFNLLVNEYLKSSRYDRIIEK